MNRTTSKPEIPPPSISLSIRLRRWLLDPSSRIEAPDRRRQAALLSGLLLSMIVLGILGETITLLFIDRAEYTGYRQTLAAILFLAVVYGISRTSHLELAAILAVLIASAGLYLSGLAEPQGVTGGYFDYLIVPLWLGSLFIQFKRLPIIIGIALGGLLIFPLLAPQVTINDILIGPFTFTLVTSLLLLIITRHRDRLEQDRQEQLRIKEAHSRREAARAEALLRAAHRLNAQLDLDAVLAAIGEEVAQALDTPVSIVTIYDPERQQFDAVAGFGLEPETINTLPGFPKAAYDARVGALGKVFAVPDIKSRPVAEFFKPFRNLNLRSIALATMEYERDLIGSLCALTVADRRDFTQDELLLLRGLANQAALALVNTRLYKDAQRRLERLQALRAIDIAITTNRDLHNTLRVLLEQITEQLRVDAAVFLLLDEQRQQMDFAAGLGFRTRALRFTHLRPGEGLAGRAALERKIIQQDLTSDLQSLGYAPAFGFEDFKSYFAAPLIAQGQVKGVLEVFHRSPLKPNQEWLNFLEALAGQAAIAIESTTLFEDLQRINTELIQAYDSTIEGWSRALDLRDRETEGHTQRVAKITLALALAMGLEEHELVHIRRGSLLHDIGKMGVPDQILLKPSKLTAEEWGIMHKHPTYAHELLSPIAYLRPSLDIPYCHHEKWDGTGYPRGLLGEQIPLAARIFAVADVYDALTSDRPYRKAWSIDKTLEYILTESGSHFDPRVVEAFLEWTGG